MTLSLEEGPKANQKQKIKFYVNPPQFAVKIHQNQEEVYKIIDNITMDSMTLLHFSLVCTSKSKEFYFMGNYIFSLEDTIPVNAIWIQQGSGFELQKFKVSESKIMMI